MEKAPSKTPHQKTKKPTFDSQKVKIIAFLLIWTGLVIVASQYIITYALFFLIGEKIIQPLWTCVCEALIYSLALITIFFLTPKLYDLYNKKHPTNNPLSTTPTEVGIKAPPTLVDLGLAPVAYIIYSVFANALTSIMQLFLPWFDADQEQSTGFSLLLDSSDRFFAILAIVFIAPIAEELIMRGWLYGKIREYLKAPLAILLISLAFALLHGQWNVGVVTFVLSIVLCGLREITGTIWSGILLHIINNAIAFYLLYNTGF